MNIKVKMLIAKDESMHRLQNLCEEKSSEH